MASGKNSVPIFSVRRKHAWRDQILRYISLILIGTVVLGTAVWFLISANFSWAKFMTQFLEKVRPEIKKEEKLIVESKEDELKMLIEKDKIVDIDAIGKTLEGNISLKVKNGPQVFFAVKKSLVDQVATLQTLLTKAKIDNKAIKKVDFRFEKIIVEY